MEKEQDEGGMNAREELEKLLDTFHSGEQTVSLRDDLAGCIRDTVALHGSGEETYAAAGNCRAGGDPDLPAGMEWPCMQNGELMTFIAQINLAEVAAADQTGLLPKTGMLYFFLGDTEPSTRMEHRVVFQNVVGELNRIKPARTPFYLARRPAGAPVSFTGCRLEPCSGLNIPTKYYAQNMLRRFEDLLENEDRIEEFYADYDALFRRTDGGRIGKMFGYGTDRHGDLEYEAALHLHADRDYNGRPEDALQELASCFEGDVGKARQAVDGVLLLLEVRSGGETGFMWGESGVLHYFIDREDLAARRFDRTYASVYSD